MKQLLLGAVCLLCVSLSSFAQSTETFDIATYQRPNGWTKQAGQDSVQFSIADENDYCIITVFRSLPGLGSSKEDFDAAWSTIVKEAVTVSAAPQMLPAETRGEWQIRGGLAPFEKDGQKGVALLYTASGFGRMMTALVLTNTQAFEPELTVFLGSISFKKLKAVRQPPAPVGPTGSQPALAGNFWKQGGIQGGMLGHVGLASATYSKTYQFLSDGTYKFFTVNMQLAAPKYYLENEEGTYSVTGNTVTITAKKASFSQHRLNKEDPPLKSGPLPLTNAKYNFDFWLHDGNWALLLSPVDGNENKRDGTFSFYRNGEPQRTYQYVLVNAKGELIR